MVTKEIWRALFFNIPNIISKLMPLSHYLRIYPWEESLDHLLLFSTRQTSKILLPKEKYRAMEHGGISPPDEALLTKLGMIVWNTDTEKQGVLGLLDEFNKKNFVLNVTVVLNLDCNFACIYCYEGDMKGKLYMSPETAERLIDFIKERLNENKKSLSIDFYGGEPLLSIELIKFISQELKSFTESRGASYRFSLVTNGSLFKRKVAVELAELGLEHVKFTLDGPPEVHNRYRPFKSGAASFDTIVKNITETWGLVKIGIGGNFDRNTYMKFPRLLHCLEKEGLTPDKISAVKFDPISNRPEGDISPTDYRDGCMSINEPWLVEAGTHLREEILKRGYRTLKPKPMFCLVENKDAYVVNYDGAIYKCPAFVGQADYAVGDLKSGVHDYTDIYKLDIWKNRQCVECEYLPLCFGGCRYMTFVRNGRIDQIDCKKDYLDATLEALIKQDIKYRPEAGRPWAQNIQH